MLALQTLRRSLPTRRQPSSLVSFGSRDWWPGPGFGRPAYFSPDDSGRGSARSDATVPLVTGSIVFPSGSPDLEGATVSVRLEDVSRADAAADVVADCVLERPADRATSAGVPFQLGGSPSEIHPGRRYEVAVHVDVEGSGDVDSGDYITTSSFEVLENGVPADGTPEEVTISVQRVG